MLFSFILFVSALAGHLHPPGGLLRLVSQHSDYVLDAPVRIPVSTIFVVLTRSWRRSHISRRLSGQRREAMYFAHRASS